MCDIELGKERIVKDSADVQSIVSTLISWVPNLYSDSQPLINISNGCPATPELINNVKTMYSRGEKAPDLFFGRIVSYSDTNEVSKLTYRSKIPRQQLLTFADKSKKNKYSSIPEDEGQSFADILSRYDKKVLDLEYLMP